MKRRAFMQLLAAVPGLAQAANLGKLVADPEPDNTAPKPGNTATTKTDETSSRLFLNGHEIAGMNGWSMREYALRLYSCADIDVWFILGDEADCQIVKSLSVARFDQVDRVDVRIESRDIQISAQCMIGGISMSTDFDGPITAEIAFQTCGAVSVSRK